MDYPDIFYLPEWAALNQVMDHGVADSFLYLSDLGCVLYPFIKRKVDIALSDIPYYDLVTPFGYNGPCIIESKEGFRQQLVADFDASFRKYCFENHIIAEYVRFSPWLNNVEDFRQIYNLKISDITVHVDLSGPDFFMDEFTSGGRNNVRKAQKYGLCVGFDYDGHSLSELEHLYNAMVDSHKIPSYYTFRHDYLVGLFDRMKSHVFIMNVLKEGTCVSSSIFLHHGESMYQHILANDPEYLHLNVSSLTIYEACKWGKEHGAKNLQLGGGGKGDNAANLIRFKKNFTRKGILPLYVGYRVLDDAIYNLLLQKCGFCNNNYFPQYRG